MNNAECINVYANGFGKNTIKTNHPYIVATTVGLMYITDKIKLISQHVEYINSKMLSQVATLKAALIQHTTFFNQHC